MPNSTDKAIPECDLCAMCSSWCVVPKAAWNSDLLLHSPHGRLLVPACWCVVSAAYVRMYIRTFTSLHRRIWIYYCYRIFWRTLSENWLVVCRGWGVDWCNGVCGWGAVRCNMHVHVPSECGRKVQRRTTFQPAPSVCESNGSCSSRCMCLHGLLHTSFPLVHRVIPLSGSSPTGLLYYRWAVVCTSSKQCWLLLPSTCVCLTCVSMQVCTYVCVYYTLHVTSLSALLLVTDGRVTAVGYQK